MPFQWLDTIFIPRPRVSWREDWAGAGVLAGGLLESSKKHKVLLPSNNQSGIIPDNGPGQHVTLLVLMNHGRNSTVKILAMSAALGDREARVVAHAWRKYKDQERKKYKLMNEFCISFGLVSRTSDQYKYVLEKKASVREALNRDDDWDSDVENLANKERIVSAPASQQVGVKVEGASGLAAEAPLQHNKRVREMMAEQNKLLTSRHLSSTRVIVNHSEAINQHDSSKSSITKKEINK